MWARQPKLLLNYAMLDDRPQCVTLLEHIAQQFAANLSGVPEAAVAGALVQCEMNRPLVKHIYSQLVAAS